MRIFVATLLSLQVLPTTTEADSGRVLNKNASFGSDHVFGIRTAGECFPQTVGTAPAAKLMAGWCSYFQYSLVSLNWAAQLSETGA